MPAGNGMGPQGKGSLTGKGMGDCAPNLQNNRNKYTQWLQFGYRRGMHSNPFCFHHGYGFRYPYNATFHDLNDLNEHSHSIPVEEILKQQASTLQSQLDSINIRLASMKNGESDKSEEPEQ